jgi:arginine decarboxylase
MSESYSEHISSIYKLNNSEYKTEGEALAFNNMNLHELIKKEGSPLKLFYLPKISSNITNCNEWFIDAIKNNSYKGKHHYSYCTKSNHFLPVIEKALSSGAHLEISSSFDFKIIDELIKRNKVVPSTFILCNGFKTLSYIDSICKKVNQGYTNTLAIVDNLDEAKHLSKGISKSINIGIRLSTEESSHHSLHTSRFGIAEKEFNLFNEQLHKYKNMRFVMLHFFINSGITDSSYYWSELEKKISFYCKIKPLCPDLKYINIGGGLKTFSSLNNGYSHKEIIEKIVAIISKVCRKNKTDAPDIFTEFGNYTVSNCACALYSVIGKKKQENDLKCLMINSSFITSLPDIWAIDKGFQVLAINNLDLPYEEVYLGGLSCDGDDFYDSNKNNGRIYMPVLEKAKDLHLAFFNTGAYQEALGGFGGLQHCLIPSPKYIFADKNENNDVVYKIFKKEQNSDQVLALIT